MNAHLRKYSHAIGEHANALTKYRATKERFWLLTLKSWATACQMWLMYYRREV